MSGKHRKQPKRNTGKLAAVGAMALSPLLVPASASAQDWDELAQCESSGNWSIDTGNGFSGGLQFTPSTWAGFGGKQYAANAKDATREQQIAVAEKVLAVQGSGAWPGCTAKTNWTSGTSSESASVQSEASAGAETTAESSEGSASVSGTVSGTYEVQAGDTLSEVALKAGVSVESVVSANDSVSDPHVIYPGQMLQLS